MKGFWFKFVLWQIWSVAADYIFFDVETALVGIAFFLVADLLCLCAYFVRRKRGDDVVASIKRNFDILPYKWWWMSGILGVVSVIHWEEHMLLCCFLWTTLFVAFVVDMIDRYGEWKKHGSENT